MKVYGDNEKTRAKWPMLFAKMDYRTIAQQTIETFSFIPKTDFNPQELAALGCEVTSVKGIPQYGEQLNTYPLCSDSFDEAWRNIAASDSDGFAQAQHEYVKAAYYDPAVLI